MKRRKSLSKGAVWGIILVSHAIFWTLVIRLIMAAIASY